MFVSTQYLGKRLVFRVRYQRHKKQVDGIREAEATRDGSEVNHHQSFCQICKRIFNRLTYLSTQGAAPSSEGAAQTEATETVPDAAVDQLVVREMENRFHTRPTNGQQPCNVPKTWLVNSHRSPNRHPTRCAKPVRVEVRQTLPPFVAFLSQACFQKGTAKYGSGSSRRSVVTFLFCGVQQFRDFFLLCIFGKFDSVVRFAPIRRPAAFIV